MDDEFLQAFNERRRLRAERDRAFEIDGVTLTHRPAVSPETPLRYQEAHDTMSRWGEDVRRRLAEANGSPPELPEQPVSGDEMIEIYDEFILACLEPVSHDAWAKLRAPDAANPLVDDDIYSLALYLLEKTTQIPTDGPPDSSDTRPATSTTSPGNSRSPARKRKASAPS